MADKKATSESTNKSRARTALKADQSGAEAELDRAGASSRWEKCWSAGLDPGDLFDTAAPCKALSHLLHERVSAGGKDVFAGKKALVPGCGRAYVSDTIFSLT